MTRFVQFTVYGIFGGIMLFGMGYLCALDLAQQTTAAKAKPSIFWATRAR
jgi:hypothetical protein